jgi:hypothetical protein
MLSRRLWCAARATVWLISIICAQAAATASGSNSCIAEFGGGSCADSLSTSLRIHAGDEVNVKLLASLASGARCVDDCALGAIFASVGSVAASGIAYIGMGNYMISWQTGRLPTVGSFSMSVSISGNTVSGSPASMIVSPGPVSPGNTLIYNNPAGGGVAGTSISFSMQLRDRYGNSVVDGGGVSFSATLLPIDLAATVSPGAGGVYVASYTCTAAASYTLVVRSNDMALQSTYQVVVRPGAKDPSAFTASGPSVGAAGGLIQYVLQGRDLYGNALTTDSSSTFSLTISHPVADEHVQVSPAVSVVYAAEGQYAVTFSLTASASYTISIRTGGASINGSPFLRMVVPASISQKSSIK